MRCSFSPLDTWVLSIQIRLHEQLATKGLLTVGAFNPRFTSACCSRVLRNVALSSDVWWISAQMFVELYPGACSTVSMSDSRVSSFIPYKLEEPPIHLMNSFACRCVHVYTYHSDHSNWKSFTRCQNQWLKWLFPSRYNIIRLWPYTSQFVRWFVTEMKGLVGELLSIQCS